jgi:hypothetical protein
MTKVGGNSLEHCRRVEVMACNRLRVGFMLSLPPVVLSRDDANLVRRRCLNGHYAAGSAGRWGEHQSSVRVLSRGVGPRAGALVCHRHKIVHARTSDAVQEALTFHAIKRKSLPPY